MIDQAARHASLPIQACTATHTPRPLPHPNLCLAQGRCRPPTAPAATHTVRQQSDMACWLGSAWTAGSGEVGAACLNSSPPQGRGLATRPASTRSGAVTLPALHSAQRATPCPDQLPPAPSCTHALIPPPHTHTTTLIISPFSVRHPPEGPHATCAQTCPCSPPSAGA